MYSSLLEKSVYGYSVVLLCWTNGKLTLPISWRWYKVGGKSKVVLARSLLREAKEVWKLKPKRVLFDSWYASDELLNLVHRYRWTFVSQLKKNRIISGAPINQDLTEEGDQVVSAVTGLVMGKIVRHDDKFFLTNDLTLTLDQILSEYGFRWQIEDIFRFLKTELHLEECQVRSKTAQETHLFSCLVAYCFVQKERQNSPDQTLYAIRAEWLINSRLGKNKINHYARLVPA